MLHKKWYILSKEEFDDLKKEVYKLSSKDSIYVFPSKIKEGKEENVEEKRYELTVKCPHCNEDNIIKNCRIKNERFFEVPLDF